MKDPARQAATAAVLAAVLDGTLRLMHPVIPFVTEKIWWQLNAVRPDRGLPGHLDCPPADKLIAAQWPPAGPTDAPAEEQFTALQEVIVAIRNVRNLYKVDNKKPVAVTLSSPATLHDLLNQNREMIELLATCTITTIGVNVPAPQNAARATAAGVEIFVENLIDPDAEKKRVEKQRDDLEKKAAALRSRLANPAYADRAPAHLVQQTRDELATVEAELNKLG